MSSEKTTTVSRLTSSVIIIQSSNTSKPRNHNTFFNLLLTEEGEGKQFHIAPVLNIGKFIYHNEERFLYEKGAEKLSELINNSTNLLSGNMLGNDPKIWTAKSRRTAHAAVSWQNVFNCNACLTGFIKRARFKEHILHWVGGHVSSMIFEKTPHIEHFESKQFPTTLLCHIVASFDTEACGNKDIERRISRDGTVFKSDSRKEAEMVLSAVVATVIIRPDRAKDFTIYKNTSMSNEELLDTSTVPYPIRRHMEVEDQCNLEMSVDEFRVSMNAFIEVKAKVIKLNVDKIENPNMKISLSEQIETHNKILLRKRTEASRRFGIFFFQLFQILMEYSKKEVAVFCKKTLRLSWKGRADLIDPILKSANTGVLYFVKKIEGEEGEMSTFLEEALTTDNFVASFKDYNCVICNQKLDPTYLQKMKTYYDHKIQQGEGDNDREEYTEDDENDYQMLVGDEIIRISRDKPPDDENEEKPKSPHVCIWASRNMWQVKEQLMIFFYSEVNRLKQQLLVASHRLKMTYIGEQNLNSIDEIPDKVALALESKAGENVSDDYKIENANDFVLTMASDEWQFTEPFSKSDRERLMECLYRFVESMVTLEQFIKVFDDESSSISVGHSSIKSFAKQNAAKKTTPASHRKFNS